MRAENGRRVQNESRGKGPSRKDCTRMERQQIRYVCIEYARQGLYGGKCLYGYLNHRVKKPNVTLGCS